MIDLRNKRIYFEQNNVEEFKALLTILQDAGCTWQSGDKPLDLFIRYKGDLEFRRYIYIDDFKLMTW